MSVLRLVGGASMLYALSHAKALQVLRGAGRRAASAAGKWYLLNMTGTAVACPQLSALRWC